MTRSASRDDLEVRSYYSTASYLRKKQQSAQIRMGKDFVKWSLNLLPTPAGAILDAGCGWGRFTWPLIEHFDVDPRRVICTDLSYGMIQDVVREGQKRHKPVSTSVSSIDALPFKNNTFSTVLANHVLYHLKDISQAASELSRVLTPDGYLLATTGSAKIKPIILDLHYRALDEVGIRYKPETFLPFTLENGGKYLKQGFHKVETYYLEDEGTYENIQDFVDEYKVTGRYRAVIEQEDIMPDIKDALLKVFESLTQEIIGDDGVLRVPWLMGAFVCSKPIKYD